MEHIFSCRYELGCSTKSGRIPSGAGIRISVLKGRPRKRRDPPESPALSSVRVTLEIEAEMPEGAPDNVVRTVTENSRTLKFESNSGFETE